MDLKSRLGSEIGENGWLNVPNACMGPWMLPKSIFGVKKSILGEI